MTRQRAALYLLLIVVAAAAAVLSFTGIRELALLCGFDPWLAWLLPITIDAGAGAASIVWLGPWCPPGARKYGRVLALLLLVGASIGGNALSHGLSAFGIRPDWMVVVGVSAIAPAVLGALVHLVVLVGRPAAAQPPPTVLLEDEFEALRKAVEAQRAAEQAEQAAAGGIPDRRAAVDVDRDGAVIDDLRAIAGRTGRRYSRDEVKDMYGMGSPRATRLLNLLGWLPRADERAAAGGDA
jgi:hypothetical protein